MTHLSKILATPIPKNDDHFSLYDIGCVPLVLAVLALLVMPAMAAGTVTKTTTAPISEIVDIVENITVVKTGSTAISSALAVKNAYPEKVALLSSTTKAALSAVSYPYSITDTTTSIAIIKYRCTSEMCGYWITATRGGKEVATNSPIWISPPPYEVVVSEVETSSKIVGSVKTIEKTITVKEDPKTATESILLMYAGMQPLGKAIVGTKE
jgi:hypothetical protein